MATGVVCWLYVAEVSKNLGPTTTAAPGGIEAGRAIARNDHANANKAPAEAASGTAPSRQDLQDLAAGLEQVKQALQQDRDRLAADLAQTQQLAQRESEQARHLAEGLATNLARELATNIEQVKQALQQQSDKAEKLVSQLPMNRPKSDVPVAEQGNESDRRLAAVTSEVAQMRQAIGALGAELDKVRQVLPSETEKNDAKVTELARELAEAKQAAQRDREGADRRGRESTAELVQLKEIVQRETDRNANAARQTSADVREIKDALRREVEQRARTADELTVELEQLKLTLRQLKVDLAASQVELAQSRLPQGRNGEHHAEQAAAEFVVAGQPHSSQVAEEPRGAPGRQIDLPGRAADLLLAKQSAGTPGDADSPARPRVDARSLPAPSMNREQPAQSSSDADDADLKRLMARAHLLISQGNISAARIVLERAAETGDGRALFALAETFDPSVLSTWGTVGTLGDAARAQELYAKALAGGVEEARSRVGR
jgi:chemotaxis protein histidine kinase CheA